MARWATPLHTEGAGGFRRKLLSPLVFEFIPGCQPIEVPAGFVTDYASVPRFLWSIFPPHGAARLASVVHDYLYSLRECPRAIADAVFLVAMKTSGVVAWRRWAMYLAVRLFGGSHKAK